MSLFKRGHEAPPPVEVPARIVNPAEFQTIEQRARLRHAARLIERTLAAQSLRGDRNRELIDALLELRSTLFPSAPDRVPVVPGRSR